MLDIARIGRQMSAKTPSNTLLVGPLMEHLRLCGVPGCIDSGSSNHLL